jgi:formylglycine-generating enzyme required for sulfatase activity
MNARRSRRIAIFALAALMIAALGSAIGFYLWIREQMSLAHSPSSIVEASKTATTTPSTAPGPAPSPPAVPQLNAAPPTNPPAAKPTPDVTAAAPKAPPATVNTPTAAVTLPAMVALPGGTFTMGSNDDASEKPIRRVTIKPFAISKFPIANRQWRQCVAAKACDYVPVGSEDAPVANISWSDAKQFAGWLAATTQKDYRLPSEAEWEYAARGGTQTKYWWGDQFQSEMANCKGCGGAYDAMQPASVGTFKANPFGLHDMGGNVHQWVEDCWHKDYQGAPTDGSAWIDKTCSSHVIRSGSWKNDTNYIRPASRDHYDTDVRYPTHGLRIAGPP